MNAFGNKEFKSSVDLTWVIRAEDIAVGAAVEANTQALEYKWMSYDVNAGVWKTIADWSSSNWAGWADNEGTYWLHCEVRDANSKQKIDEQTIAFAYAPRSAELTAHMRDTKRMAFCLVSTQIIQGKLSN